MLSQRPGQWTDQPPVCFALSALAIALGAIVAPPDAAAATAILRQVNLPYRILKILEGESLLNDASALLIYRVAVGAEAVQQDDRWRVARAGVTHA